MVRFGVSMFPTDKAIQPVALARALEARGFDSVFFPEHTHIPVSRKTPFPGGGDLPEMYWRSHDPFVALAACAAVTQRLRLGTGICLVIERDPITLAKEVASLDMISNGRVILGIGAGWNREEMENHGAPFKERWAAVREKVLAMRAIWTQDEAEFHGRHVRFDPMWCWPKPVTKPHPPVFIGGESEHTLARIVRHADGWLPRVRDPEKVLAGSRRLRELARAAGRAEDSIAISAFGVAGRHDALAPFRDAGFQRAIIALPPGTLDETLSRLDRYAMLTLA